MKDAPAPKEDYDDLHYPPEISKFFLYGVSWKECKIHTAAMFCLLLDFFKGPKFSYPMQLATSTENA